MIKIPFKNLYTLSDLKAFGFENRWEDLYGIAYQILERFDEFLDKHTLTEELKRHVGLWKQSDEDQLAKQNANKKKAIKGLNKNAKKLLIDKLKARFIGNDKKNSDGSGSIIKKISLKHKKSLLSAFQNIGVLKGNSNSPNKKDTDLSDVSSLD